MEKPDLSVVNNFLHTKKMFYGVCIVGVLANVFAYAVPFNNLVKKTEEIELENQTLTENIAIWKPLYENKEQYLSEIEDMRDSIADVYKEYPSLSQEEDVVMLAVNIQNDTKASISNINMSVPEMIYSIEEPEVLNVEIEDFTGALEWNDLKASYVISGSYTDLKDVVALVYKQKNNIGISSITLSKQDEGELLGNIDIDFYFLNGTTKEYKVPKITQYVSGTENIFGMEIKEE